MPKQGILSVVVSFELYNPALPVVAREVLGAPSNGSIANLLGCLMRKLFLQMGDQELASPRDHA